MSDGPSLDFPAAFKPPAGGGTPKPPAADKPPAKPRGGGRQAPLQGRLQEMIGGIGVIVVPFNEVDGMAIIAGAERLSIALDKAAKQNPSVRRTLEKMLSGSVWGEVVFASAAIVAPIAINHGMLPSAIKEVMPGMKLPSENGDGPHSD